MSFVIKSKGDSLRASVGCGCLLFVLVPLLVGILIGRGGF